MCAGDGAYAVPRAVVEHVAAAAAAVHVVVAGRRIRRAHDAVTIAQPHDVSTVLHGFVRFGVAGVKREEARQHKERQQHVDYDTHRGTRYHGRSVGAY